MPWLPHHPPRTTHHRSGLPAPAATRPLALLLGLILACLSQLGCNLLPQRLDRPQIHNPFPQLRKVAVVPFFNQSGFAQINGADVANSYRHQLQQIPGFEVLPVGVVDRHLASQPIPVDQAPDFQQLARDLGVDAVVVGSITDFDPYYPPRLGLAVRWYAANPSYHPIPPGYGLPWGTAEEEYIPADLRFEAEFALASEQLKTQTPLAVVEPPADSGTAAQTPRRSPPTRLASDPRSADSNNAALPSRGAPAPLASPPQAPRAAGAATSSGTADPMATGPTAVGGVMLTGQPDALPADWPDPNGFVPDRPMATRPPSLPQAGPVMELIKQYDGSNSELTARLESYFAFRDDARFGGWQSYLERTDDFINFCCYLHISELLTARGGAGYARPVWRWPLATYQP